MSELIALPQPVTDISEKLKTELGDIEEAVTTYSLSDALREGESSGAKQNFNTWEGPDGSVCALSMAAAAVRARGLA